MAGIKTRLIYFHIPKTGGQSFNNILDREYRKLASYDTHIGLMNAEAWQRIINDLQSTAPEYLARYTIYKGHMRLSMHDLVPFPAQYITMLRDPIKRALSYCNMYFNIKGLNHTVLDISKPNWGVDDYTLINELDNGQVRYLSNAPDSLPLGSCTEEHLKVAKQNLETRFSFVGLTERFDLSLMMLTRIYGWRWHFYIPKNVAAYEMSSVLSPKELTALSGLNRLDRELYTFAEDRFNKMLSEFGTSFYLARRSFVFFNSLHKVGHKIKVSVSAR